MIYYEPRDPWTLKRLQDKLRGELVTADPQSILTRLKAAHLEKIQNRLKALVHENAPIV